mgnify:FL=1
MLDQTNDQAMADVVFVVEGERVKLHRAILAARSEYFRRMLTNGAFTHLTFLVAHAVVACWAWSMTSPSFR